MIVFLLFLVAGFLGDGFKSPFSFFIFLILSFLFFYIKNIKIKVDYAFLFVVVIIFSSFFSEFNRDAFFSLIIWCVSLFFYYFSSSFKEIEKKLLNESFVKAITIFSVFLSGLVIIAFLAKNRFYYMGENPNYAGIILSISFFVSFLKFFKKKEKIYLISFLISIPALILLNSRGAYFSLFASFIIYFAVEVGIKKTLFGVLFFLLIFCFLPEEIIRYILKLDDPKAYYRIDIWITGLKAFLSSPLWGFGGGSFEHAFEKFKFPFFDGFCYYNHSTVHAHNEFLNIAVENGVFCLIMYFLILKKWIFSPQKNEIYFSVLIMSLFSIFDIVLKLPFMKMLYFLMLGYYSGGFNYEIEFRKIFIWVVFFVILFFSVPRENFDKYGSAYLEIFSTQNNFRKSVVSEYASKKYHFNPIFLFEISKFYHSIGVMDKALFYANKALEIEPNFNNALLMASDIHFRMKNKEKSLYYISKITPPAKFENSNLYRSYLSSLNFKLYYYLIKEISLNKNKPKSLNNI